MIVNTTVQSGPNMAQQTTEYCEYCGYIIGQNQGTIRIITMSLSTFGNQQYVYHPACYQSYIDQLEQENDKPFG